MRANLCVLNVCEKKTLQVKESDGKGKNLLRHASKGDWTDVDLDALKTEMYEELARINKKELADMISQQEARRFPEPQENSVDSMSREDSMSASNLSGMNDSEMSLLRAQIVEEMTEMTKRELSNMMDQQMQLRWKEVVCVISDFFFCRFFGERNVNNAVTVTNR